MCGVACLIFMDVSDVIRARPLLIASTDVESSPLFLKYPGVNLPEDRSDSLKYNEKILSVTVVVVKLDMVK